MPNSETAPEINSDHTGAGEKYWLAVVVILSLAALALALFTQGFSLDNGLVYGAF
jgi:hypothetical protein